LAHSLKLSTVHESHFDGVFYPGGHGPLWDLVNDETSINLIEDFYKHSKPLAFVCHAPGALINVKAPEGEPFVQDKNITGFSDSEEAAVNLTYVVPFLLQDELTKLGGIYSKGPDWASYVQKDGILITGQNPASSEEVAKLLLKSISEKLN
jgi:putative intracellular protease/amidase